MKLGKKNFVLIAVIVFFAIIVFVCGKTDEKINSMKKSRIWKNIFSSLLARLMEVELSIKTSSFKPKDFRGAQ